MHERDDELMIQCAAIQNQTNQNCLSFHIFHSNKKDQISWLYLTFQNGENVLKH